MDYSLCEAAIKGDIQSLKEIMGVDPLILHKFVVGYFDGKSPLHMATSSSQTDFVKELLSLNPELTEVLDSQQRSALHLASAKGLDDIVRELLGVSPDMCLARDRDGKNPLHVAAIKGNVSVLEELVQTNPHAAQVRVDRNETILHLCVKHDQPESLKLLLEKIQSQGFVNAKDDDGNTILHIAILDKRYQLANHILENNKIHVNAKNGSGQTAMDILFLVDVGPDQKESDPTEKLLQASDARRANDLVAGEWLTNKRDSLMVVSSLIATMAFQAGVNPPGGVWQENSNGHRAGEAVMAYNYAESYPYFLRFNTIGFVASLSTILLLIGLKFKNKAAMWILVLNMWLAITSMAVTYAFSSVVLTPKKDRQSLVVIAVIAWCIVIALLLLRHTVHLVAVFVEEKRDRKRSIKRITKFDQQKWPRSRSLIREILGLNVGGECSP